MYLWKQFCLGLYIKKYNDSKKNIWRHNNFIQNFFVKNNLRFSIYIYIYKRPTSAISWRPQPSTHNSSVHSRASKKTGVNTNSKAVSWCRYRECYTIYNTYSRASDQLTSKTDLIIMHLFARIQMRWGARRNAVVSLAHPCQMHTIRSLISRKSCDGTVWHTPTRVQSYLKPDSLPWCPVWLFCPLPLRLA